MLNAAGNKASLPYLVWSSGQREFVPLLLGFYWLMPSLETERRAPLKWVLIEELEMGLHPEAITTTLLLVLELIRRGYKVCLSTHSSHVLDLVWSLRVIKEHRGRPEDLLDLFELPSNKWTRALAEKAIAATTSVYFFPRSGEVMDISRLDPGADVENNPDEVKWGGLSEFAGKANEVVAKVVNRSEGSTDDDI